MLIAVKNKSEWKYVKSTDILVDGVTLGDLIARLDKLQYAYEQLTTELKNHYIVKKDTDYIIQLDNKLKRVSNIQLYPNQETRLPIEFYKIENDKLVEDKDKIGAVL